MDFNELIEVVENWADEKGILEGDWLPQWRKVEEEFQELAYELTNNGTRKNTMLELGDLVVTLIILAPRLGIDLTESLHMAYNKIKDRKGETRNGTFYKFEENAKMVSDKCSWKSLVGENIVKTLLFSGSYVDVYKLANGMEEVIIKNNILNNIQSVVMDKTGFEILDESPENAFKKIAEYLGCSFQEVVGNYQRLRMIGLSHEVAMSYCDSEEDAVNKYFIKR